MAAIQENPSLSHKSIEEENSNNSSEAVGRQTTRKLSKQVLISQTSVDIAQNSDGLEQHRIPQSTHKLKEPHKHQEVFTNQAFSYEGEGSTNESHRSSSSISARTKYPSTPIVTFSHANGETTVMCTMEAATGTCVEQSSLFKRQFLGNILIETAEHSSEALAPVAIVNDFSMSVPIASSNNNINPKPDAPGTDTSLPRGMPRSVSAVQLAAANAAVQEPNDDDYVKLTPEEHSRFLTLYVCQVSSQSCNIAGLQY